MTRDLKDLCVFGAISIQTMNYNGNSAQNLFEHFYKIAIIRPPVICVRQSEYLKFLLT